MNVSREKKKVEAIARMKLWGIFSKTIEQFEKSNLVSESVPPFGACFWLNEEQKQRVKKFEDEHNGALVYHVIHSYADFGECENYLYVSDYPEEWEYDRMDIKVGQQVVYAENLSAPWCSELGSIGISRTPAGGLVRVW